MNKTYVRGKWGAQKHSKIDKNVTRAASAKWDCKRFTEGGTKKADFWGYSQQAVFGKGRRG